MVKTKHREAPDTPTHLRSLAPIPEDIKDPVAWAEKHVEAQAPHAAKEMEWALKFGSDTARYVAARDLLAMKGLTTKPKDTTPIQQAMVVNFNGPVTPSGMPIMPFMNAEPVLPATTVDGTVVASKVDIKPDTRTVREEVDLGDNES